MKIEFYNKETKEIVTTGDYFVLHGNEVWCDNYEVYESQAGLIGFDDCISECSNIGWRLADS